MRLLYHLLLCTLAVVALRAAEPSPTIVRVQVDQPRQAIQGMGGGAIFYEAHITSLAERQKHELQERLYDDLFTHVRTDFLHLMIRHDHEPANDNADPYVPAFRPGDFAYTRHTLAICQAARQRHPGMRLYATLYTPPVWMKTNGEPGAGGKSRATLKPGHELELAEYVWAFLDWMHRHGQTVEFVSIANEPDWPHTQPGYCLDPQSHAALFRIVGDYLVEMERRYPGTPRAQLVGPNVLSAVDCAERWVPPLLDKAGEALAVVGSHDYDRRGDRWRRLVEVSRGRPVWATEWCVNGEDHSPGLLRSAAEYWLAMTEAFNGGAHAWMAYDWVYPPRPGGEALVHVDWGSGYTLTKIYHGYRQWCLPLVPGMRNVPTQLSGPAAADFSKPGLKVAAFVSPDGRRLVVHAAAVQDSACPLELHLEGPLANLPVRRLRTSATEDMVDLPAVRFQEGQLADTVPPRGMVSYLIGYPNP